MKKAVCGFWAVIIMLNIGMLQIKADNLKKSEEPSDLYGLSALLMDAETGEVLFEKNGDDPMAIASTTKILTCLIALEEGDMDDIVTISANAAAQPDVQMNAAEGEQYRLSDLLKGMMLESYNDISVAVAEHISGSVDAFSDKMNQRAGEIGCVDSYFITPNGLDDEKNGIENHSTAKDLALILSHAIKNDDFLTITRTTECVIREIDGKRVVTASNKNRFLNEYKGMISGKTGFTGKAGYCYAGAAKRDDRTFVAVTLGSGWPPHKNYKWTDIRSLLDYGFETYQMQSIDFQNVALPEVLSVADGVNEHGEKVDFVRINIPEVEDMLLKEGETYYGKVYIRQNISAPVKKNEVLGRIEIYRNEKLVGEKKITAIDDVEKADMWMKIYNMLRYFFVKINGNLLKLENLQAIIR